MKINIIAAIGKNNEIGLDNKLLWKSKSDLEHFKRLTLGKPIIMGRKTFESLPGILPGRSHFVVGSKHKLPYDIGVTPCHSLKQALTICSMLRMDEEVFIIGGGSIYEQAMELADELHISHMNWEGEADTFFPEIDKSIWKEDYSRTTFRESEITWTYRKYIKKENT